ncbi:MAG TPA: ABC transporter permease [Gemmatimonadaceae bacterium]|nr:ABC transporter permease [Gemmatimonadaceae bacterium]
MDEIRLAIRSLLKSKLFAAVAILTLVIGIGATTAVFSVFDAVALRPLPFAEPHRLVDIEEWSATALCAGCGVGVSGPMVEDLERRMTTVQSLALYREGPVNVGGTDAPQRVSAASVSGNFFTVLGVNAATGRAIDLNDDRPGSPRVAVLSRGYFERAFAADAGVIGRTIRINGAPATVVGVMPPSAVLPEFAQIWVPLDRSSLATDRSARDLGVIARLKDGISREQADAEVKLIAADLAEAYPETQERWTARIRSLRDAVGDDDRGPFGLMLGAVLVLWAVVCANLAALLLARGVSRRREIAVRLAVGGSRRAVVWHLLAESLCLAAVGGILGAIAASWVVDGLLATLDTPIPAYLTPRLDATTLAFCVVLSLVSVVAFGLLPAIRASRPDVHDDLKAGSPGSVGGSGGTIRGSLVVLQLTLSLALLAVAGVLSNTIGRMSAGRSGDDADIVQARVEVLGSVPPDRLSAIVGHFVERFSALPEVRSAAASASGFIAGFGSEDTRIRVEGIPEVAAGVSPRFYHAVTPSYFETSRIALLEGRAFTTADRAGAPPVVIVNHRLAEQLWRGEPAVGRRIKLGADSLPWRTIVGVVANTGDTASRRFSNIAYVPFPQSPMPAVTFRVAARGEPQSVLRPMREAARSVDPDLPLLDVMTNAQAQARQWRPMRAYAFTISAIGIVALVLAAIGLYGVVAYGAQQRTREIGVRIALGAQRRDVIRLVTRQGLGLVTLGVIFGTAAAVLVAPLMRGMLFGATPFNVVVFACSAGLLIIVAAIASYLPARRAAKTNPMLALRSE